MSGNTWFWIYNLTLQHWTLDVHIFFGNESLDAGIEESSVLKEVSGFNIHHQNGSV